VWLAFTGVGVKITQSWSVGVAYDFRQASTRFSDDSHEISPYLSIRLNRHWQFTPYGVVGLSEGAPDWGLGSSVSYQF
jgi:hypothetical protein